MIFKFTALAAASAMLTAAPAFAADGSTAQLSGLKGQVLVSTGGQMAAAAAGALHAGDRVIARSNGYARVQFADGCVVTLKPSSMMTVGAASPCASGQGVVSASGATAMADDDDGSGFVKATGIWILSAFVINELVTGQPVSP